MSFFLFLFPKNKTEIGAKDVLEPLVTFFSFFVANFENYGIISHPFSVVTSPTPRAFSPSFFGVASMTEQSLVSVQFFKPHVCVDCGAKLSKFGAVRCKECHMRKVGKFKKRKKRKRK